MWMSRRDSKLSLGARAGCGNACSCSIFGFGVLNLSYGLWPEGPATEAAGPPVDCVHDLSQGHCRAEQELLSNFGGGGLYRLDIERRL